MMVRKNKKKQKESCEIALYVLSVDIFSTVIKHLPVYMPMCILFSKKKKNGKTKGKILHHNVFHLR